MAIKIEVDTLVDREIMPDPVFLIVSHGSKLQIRQLKKGHIGTNFVDIASDWILTAVHERIEPDDEPRMGCGHKGTVAASNSIPDALQPCRENARPGEDVTTARPNQKPNGY
jgi:hypothetical protein